MILMEEYQAKTYPEMIWWKNRVLETLLKACGYAFTSKFSNEDTLVPASWGPWGLVMMSEVKMAMPALRCEPNDQMALKYVETSVLVAREAFLAGFSVWNARPQNMKVLFLFAIIRKLIALWKLTMADFPLPQDGNLICKSPVWVPHLPFSDFSCVLGSMSPFQRQVRVTPIRTEIIIRATRTRII